jgi:hypothetical protein
MDKDEQNNLLDAVAGIFIRCFFLSVGILLFWFVFYLLAGNWAYSIHSKWFELSRHEFDLMWYYGMAFFKLCAFLFFLFPYLAIKLVLRKNHTNA